MNIASGTSLVEEDVSSGLELRATTLRKQAQIGRTSIRAELNQIDQMLEKSRHN
jgi:hypothetical protein